MDRIRLKDKTFELFITDSQLQTAIQTMASRIRQDMEGKQPLLVGILNGAFLFTAELVRALDGPYEVTFARYASYAGTASTGKIREIMPITMPIEGRTLILLEDIIDTGFTMKYVKQHLLEQGAAEVRLATLLFKPQSLTTGQVPEYVGFEIPSKFIIGYGLDLDGQARGLRDIWVLKDKEK